MMRFSQLLPIAPGTLHGDPETEVAGVSHDSRAVSPGQLYAALPGANVHGAKFAPELIRGGVDAILTDDAGWQLITEALSTDEAGRDLLAGVTALIVEAPRAVLGFVSAAVYGTTSVPELIGVTGTNGKTTTTYLADGMLAALGHRTAVIGTVAILIAGDTVPSVRTTPEAPELHALFAKMRAAEVDTCCDGGLLPRAQPAPRRRGALQRRRVHEPVPGPPRLPQHDGGVLRGQGAAVHPHVLRQGSHRRRRRMGRADDGGRAGARAHLWDATTAASGASNTPRARRTSSSTSTTGRASDSALRCRATSTSRIRPWRPRCSSNPEYRRQRSTRSAAASWPRCPDGWRSSTSPDRGPRGITPGAPAAGHRRLFAHPRRDREGLGDPARRLR
jgi:hypothetical protein